MKPKVLVVEDELSILENVLYSLQTEGFDAVGCRTGAEAMGALLGGDDIRLAVLDIGLPDTTGFDLCREMRSRTRIPIIFLTARDAEIDRVLGLELGADDYVVKPFSPRELSARVRAVLRRCAAAAPDADAAPAQTGGGAAAPLEVDGDRMVIRYFGEPLPLSSTEFRLLRTLCAHPGRVYSRSQLMHAAWDEPDAAMERTVDAHIKSLRSKMRAVRAEPDALQTHRGLGYSLRETW